VQPDLLQILGIAVGLVMVGAGLWLQRRRVDPEKGEPGRGLSNASRAAIGISLMVAGYHVAAYVSPEGWFSLKVPLDRAWLLGVALAIVVGASLFLDARDRGRSGVRG
jgi:hypothetical protein